MKKYIAMTLLLFGSATTSRAQFAVDPGVEAYKVTTDVSGNLISIGSDTLNSLIDLWGEGFSAKYPDIDFQIHAKGGSTAPPALIAGVAQLGPMSRPMNVREIAAFEAKFGYQPLAIKVAVNALAVYAHKDNPLKGLTMQQVDAIFSSTRKRGGEDVKTWDQVGVDKFKGLNISIYGRNSASETYGFFKMWVMELGDFKDAVKEQPGSTAVVKALGDDEFGIGYAGSGYKTDAVRYIPLAGEAGKFVELNQQNCLDGSYPLARYLYIYVNKKPGKPLDKLTSEFLKFILSKEGQEVVVRDGFVPISAKMTKEMHELLK